jgi:hypothetical protein
MGEFFKLVSYAKKHHLARCSFLKACFFTWNNRDWLRVEYVKRKDIP